MTPATSVTINKDIEGSDRKTVWFNSRFYRINLLWENGSLRIRDIHLFNEKLPSVYEKQKATSNECSFFTLPVVDGYLWSTAQQMAGLRLKTVIDGKEILLEGSDPVVTSPASGKLHVSWPLKTVAGTLLIDMDERQISMKVKSEKPLDWFMDLSVADKAKLPFTKIEAHQVNGKFEGMDYKVKAEKGSFIKSTQDEVFDVRPESNAIVLNLSGTAKH